MPTDTDALIQQLARADAYPHPVGDIQVAETHISYVILTGEFVYKIKKPVNLGFLDFSTLDKRRHFCDEEIRLNRRLAPDLYLSVEPVTGTLDNPVLGGSGAALEYAVKMKQFPGDARLDQLSDRGALTDEMLIELAERLAAFHQALPSVAAGTEYGTPEIILARTRENFAQITSRSQDLDLRTRLRDLERRSIDLHNSLAEEFIQRRAEGWIRECHGDLHLGNIALIDGKVTPFDCLEFSPELRCIDTFSEIAFLYMDLTARGHPEQAELFLNRYLAETGDYMGLSLLRYYCAYRAMVRAKVAAISASQHSDPREATPFTRELDRYLQLADRFLAPLPPPIMILMQGVSGSGKSWLARELADATPAIHLRSDVERKRLLGFHQQTSTPDKQAAYSDKLTLQTYKRLQALSYSVIDAGYPVIVDATFLKQDYRLAFERLAKVAGVRLWIVSAEAPREVLVERINRRLQAGGDPSEATVEVMEHQLETREPLTPEEQASTITINTAEDIVIPTLCQQLGLTLL